jgi:hypothetical protein
MNKPQGYPVKTAENQLLFQFESISEKKRINKAVYFNKLSESPLLFEMVMGDIGEDENIDFLSVSNNDDRDEVLYTVFQIMAQVLDKFPNAKIVFYGSTPVRTRLYRILISKFLETAQGVYIIKGIIDDKLELFNKNTNYSAFVVHLKN